jgi:ComF family protein
MRVWGALAIDLLGELVSPSTCAACDARVKWRTAFCPSCACTLVPAKTDDAAFEYGGAIARAITKMKYADRPDLARPLGAALLRIAARLPAVDAVTPVPLHPKRLAERGFNQAALLAAPLARMLEVPYVPRAIVRSRDTPRQAELDREARRLNVVGAFTADPDRVCGRRWLLVDDVRTTGATLAACARALKTAGAANVMPISLATAI